MKKYLIAALAVLVSPLAAAYGNGDVFDVWGHGITPWEAKNHVMELASQQCRQLGYTGSRVEIVQMVESGGVYNAYALAACY